LCAKQQQDNAADLVLAVMAASPAGHYSTIVKQMRGRAKPDGMVLVVGGCATGEAGTCHVSSLRSSRLALRQQ
jgi:hypothetical protein